MQKWNVICVMLKRTTDSGDWREAVTWVSFRAWQTHTVSGESTWSKQQSTASDRATDTEGDTQTNKPDMQIKTHHKLFSSCGPERFPPPPQPPLFSCRVHKCNRMVSFYHSSSQQNPHGPTNRKTEWGWRGAGWRSPRRIRPATRSTERSSLSATSQEGNQLRVVEKKVKELNEGC